MRYTCRSDAQVSAGATLLMLISAVTLCVSVNVGLTSPCAAENPKSPKSPKISKGSRERERPGSNVVSEPSDAWLQRFWEVARSAPNRAARRAINRVLKDPARYRFQVLITEYTRDRSGEVTLTPHRFRIDAEYFYPASAIKTFGSVAALSYFTELREENPWLTLEDPLAFKAQRCKRRASNHVATKHQSLGHIIRETQLVSSNRAFNRVFNITGFRGLHERILPDFPSVRVFHRLSSSETHRESLETPALSVCDWRRERLDAKRRWSRRAFTASAELKDLEASSKPHGFTGLSETRAGLKAGVAYIHMKTKERVEAPMDFTLKNRASFIDFQRLTMGVLQPQLNTPFGPAIRLFQSRAEGSARHHAIHTPWLDRLRHAMAIYPRDSRDPHYKGASLSETRFKPMIRGVRWADERRLSDARVYYLNKAGKALGFHMDNAFIGYASNDGEISARGYHTRRLKRGLFITVGLYVNRDQTLNDNRYEYRETSVPALNAIGYAAGRYLLGELR